MGNEEVTELVLYEESGDELLRTSTSAKGYRKSLETGELWALHPDTGRLLPVGGGVSFLSLFSTEQRVEATVDEDVADSLRRMEGSIVQEHTPTHESGEEHDVSKADSDEQPRAGGALTGSEAVNESSYAELEALERTVSARHEEGGEGSYTAYLFTQGESKIRKKLGEEAIELCLAEDNSEIVRESADLLYHLSVLLCERGLSYADIMAELQRRRE